MAVVALGTLPLHARATALREGEVAASDLLAPVDVQVSPVFQGERIATPDGQLLPAVVRLIPAVLPEAEQGLATAFAEARARFAGALEAAFGERVISEEKIASRRFQDFCREFVAGHAEFPVGYVLAAAWARGDDGEVVRLRMRAVLRQVMDRRLIGTMPRAGTVFVVSLPVDGLVRSWSDASGTVVRAVEGTSVLSLEAARAELWQKLGVGERFAGGFLETLVRETMRYDARLTALFLHEKLGNQLEGRFVGRGDIIVRAGQPVDALAAAVLRELEQLGVTPLTPLRPGTQETGTTREADVRSGQAPTASQVPPQRSVKAALEPPVAAPAPMELGPMRRWMVAMVVLLVVAIGLGGWAYLKLRRLGRAAALVSARPRDAAGLREVLAPHLAREMTERGMQALFTQRQELLAEAAVATDRVADAESRVAAVQPALQERMQSYERRIRALERELQEK